MDKFKPATEVSITDYVNRNCKTCFGRGWTHIITRKDNSGKLISERVICKCVRKSIEKKFDRMESIKLVD